MLCLGKGVISKKLWCFVAGEEKQMFGLSTELIAKDKLAAVKRCDILIVSPSSEQIGFALMKGLNTGSQLVTSY